MRSIKTTLAAAAVITAGLAFAAPAAQAASAPHQASAACNTAVTAANSASAAYNAALASYKAQVAAGGNPGAAEQANLASLQNAANLATSDAARICGVSPVGPIRTGVGSTSQGADTTEVAAGVALLGAVGVGAVAMRRRRVVGGEA